MLLLTGASAAAAPIYMSIEFGRSLVDFGEDDAWLTLYETAGYVTIGDDNTSSVLDPIDVELVWSGALAQRTTDPALSTSRYEFISGDIAMQFWWLDPESGWDTGFFRGSLNAFAFEVNDNEVSGPQVAGLSGSGMLDANLARFLGVSRHATLTNLSFLLDEVYGQPGGNRWAIGGCCQYVDLALTPVPEPGLGLLSAIGATWILRRRLRRRSSRR